MDILEGFRIEPKIVDPERLYAETLYAEMNMLNPSNWEGMKQIHAEDLKEMMDDKADFVLIDARGHDAYDKEHITGAVSIPSDHLGERITKDYDKETIFITYCSNLKCDASTVAATKLERYGYKKVLQYKAGIEDWRAHRYPTVTKGH